jgi:hypothetical protein
VGTLALSLIFSATPSFQSCIEDHKTRPQYSELYEKQKTLDIIRIRIYLNGGCVGHVFYAEHDSIEALAALTGALFSFVLMVSTVLLWAETKRLALGGETQSKDMRDSIAEAARAAKAMEDLAAASIAQAEAIKRQATASVAAELSEFVIGRIDLVNFPDAAPGISEATVPGGPLENPQYKIVITGRNAGRTKSRLIEMCVEWIIVPRLGLDNIDPPEEPIYTHKAAMANILTPDELVSYKWSCIGNDIITITEQQSAAIRRNDAWLWVYGYFIYTNFLQDEIKTSFVAHWEAVTGGVVGAGNLQGPRGFVTEGPPAYNNKR